MRVGGLKLVGKVQRQTLRWLHPFSSCSIGEQPCREQYECEHFVNTLVAGDIARRNVRRNERAQAGLLARDSPDLLSSGDSALDSETRNDTSGSTGNLYCLIADKSDLLG
jgi:hypothetical protein